MRKKKDDKIINIKNETCDILTDSTGIERTIKEYYEQLCINVFDNLNEMDNFLEGTNSQGSAKKRH